MPPRTRKAYEDTDIPVYETREKIAKLLRQIGASGVAWMDGDHPEQPDKLVIALRFIRPEQVNGKAVPVSVRMMVSVPRATARSDKDREKQQEQLLRQHHRVLYWYLDAQVKAVAFGLLHFTEAFLPHLETGDGRTVFQHIAPQYLYAAAGGEIRPLALLPGRAWPNEEANPFGHDHE